MTTVNSVQIFEPMSPAFKDKIEEKRDKEEIQDESDDNTEIREEIDYDAGKLDEGDGEVCEESEYIAA